MPGSDAGRASLPARTSKGCGLYSPGHNVHFIQTRVATREPSKRVVIDRVEVRTLDLLLTFDGSTRPFWNHHLECTADALPRATAPALLLPTSLLIIRALEGWRTFYLANGPSRCRGSDVFDVAAVVSFDVWGQSLVADVWRTTPRALEHYAPELPDGAAG